MTAPADSEAQLHKVLRVREVLRCTRVVLGLCVLIGMASLLGARVTAPLEQFSEALATWLIGQVAVVCGLVFGLRALRRRWSSRMPPTSDLLLAIAGMFGGALALAWFVPVVFAGSRRPSDLAIAGLGLVLVVSGLRSAWLFVRRP